MKKDYSEYIHRHNFAVWAASRASQRGFTSIKNLKNALESTSIKSFVENPVNQEKFETNHRLWCNQICKYLKSLKLDKTDHKITYGRAAKLVNVYLKSMIVLKNLKSDASVFIHPPIDRILLQNIAKSPDINIENSKYLKNINWTELTEYEYFELIAKLKKINGNKPFWQLEEYWDVVS